MDTSDELNEYGIRMYQSHIGALQWEVTLERLDINTSVMTMSSFCSAPRKGYIEHGKHIYGYL